MKPQIAQIEKNNPDLDQVKVKVDEAVQLERKIDRLDDAIAFLGNDVGFLDIRVNYNNQGEVRLADLLGSSEVHAAFSDQIQGHVVEYRNKLVDQFNNLKITGGK